MFENGLAYFAQRTAEINITRKAHDSNATDVMRIQISEGAWLNDFSSREFRMLVRALKESLRCPVKNSSKIGYQKGNEKAF